MIKNRHFGTDNHFYGAGFLTIFIIIWIGKIYSAATVELLPEEAYYWTYSQNPALSYFDHPPMVAWIIRSGTAIFGNSEFGVRFGNLMLSFGSLVLIFCYSRFWFGVANAFWSAFLFSILPIYVGTSILAFPDGPLIFF